MDTMTENDSLGFRILSKTGCSTLHLYPEEIARILATYDEHKKLLDERYLRFADMDEQIESLHARLNEAERYNRSADRVIAELRNSLSKLGQYDVEKLGGHNA
jgi:uncharacterized coiled-coil DUF342 family protein